MFKAFIDDYKGKNSLKRYTKTQNLSSFQSSPDKNIIWVLGISGSGKSTLANYLSKEYKAEVIHLDGYFELYNKELSKNLRNSNFSKFCKAKGFNISLLSNRNIRKNNKEEFFKACDKFGELLREYGKYLYSKNIGLIIEGVELIDETIYVDKTFMNSQPVIELIVDGKIAHKRAVKRDSKL